MFLAEMFVLSFALLRPCIAQAQTVDYGPHRVALQLGLGPFYGGVDEDGHHEDKGSSRSATLSYGFLLTQHVEAGASFNYWNSNTAVSDAFLFGGRLRGIITFGDTHIGEIGFEGRAGYLGWVTPNVSDDSGPRVRDRYWHGFALSAGVDGAVWATDHLGFTCGANLTVGSASDTTGVPGYYLPERGGMISLEGRCGVRMAFGAGRARPER